MASGYAGSVDGALDYRRANQRHDVRLGARGNLLGYPGYMDHPAAGAVSDLTVKASLGGRATLTTGGRLGYEPLFNAFSSGVVSTPLPPAAMPTVPVAGVIERRSFSTDARVATETRLSRRDSHELSYGFRSQAFLQDSAGTDVDASSSAGDSLSHALGTGYKRVLGRGMRALVDYRYMAILYADVQDFTRTTHTHRVEGGADVEHRVGRNQLVTWSAVAGASHISSLRVDRQPYAAWLPVGSSSVRVLLSNRWHVETRYQREFSLLQGITDAVYATDTASITTAGDLGSSLRLRFVGSFANWKTPLASGISDSFYVYGAGVQARTVLTDTVAITGAYYFYYHRYSNPAQLPSTFPARYDRNAVRIGLTVTLPTKGIPDQLMSGR